MGRPSVYQNQIMVIACVLIINLIFNLINNYNDIDITGKPVDVYTMYVSKCFPN